MSDLHFSVNKLFCLPINFLVIIFILDFFFSNLPMDEFFMAIHIGAGFHSSTNANAYKKLCREACLAARRTYFCSEKRTKDDLMTNVDVICEAISVLENSELTNAGIGSNLNREGNVECDASIMATPGKFSGVGCVSNVVNPIRVASALLKQRMENNKSPLIMPHLLCGSGATKFAASIGLEGIEVPSKMKTERSVKTFNEWTERLANKAYKDEQTIFQDTVGAVFISKRGKTIIAGVSSGGILLKLPGRVGEAAIMGAGCYVVEKNGIRVGCSVSGTGEQIMQTLLAQKICTASIELEINMSEVLENILNEFISSPLRDEYISMNVGFILVKSYDDGG
jgi:taspase (threonine aspartase 1)